jgi:hypothetical protein
MVRPDFLPVTVILISRDRGSRSLREWFGFGLLLTQTSFRGAALFVGDRLHPVDKLALPAPDSNVTLAPETSAGAGA